MHDPILESMHVAILLSSLSNLLQYTIFTASIKTKNSHGGTFNFVSMIFIQEQERRCNQQSSK